MKPSFLFIFSIYFLVSACSHQQSLAKGDQHRSKTIHKRFVNAKKWAKRFDNPQRDEWQKPNEVLRIIELPKRGKVADVGAGTGYFSVRMAKANPELEVVAVDIEDSLLNYMAERAKREKLTNLKTFKSLPNKAALPQKLDAIFLCNAYHHLPNRMAYLNMAKTKLNTGGRIIIVDWKAGKQARGPQNESHKTPAPMIDNEMKKAGYRQLLLDEKTLPHQFIVIYTLKQE